jgi:hypothetical protein
VYQLRLEVVVDLPAQPTHQNLENVREGIVIFIPHVRGDCGAIDDNVFVRRQKLQERKLFRGQLDWFPGANGAARGQIHLEIGNRDFARRQ